MLTFIVCLIVVTNGSLRLKRQMAYFVDFFVHLSKISKKTPYDCQHDCFGNHSYVQPDMMSDDGLLE